MLRGAREKRGSLGSTAVGLWAIIPAKSKHDALLSETRKTREAVQ
jgi:hypothetical protein